MKRPKRSSTACSLRLCVENVVNSFATIHPEHRASTQKSNRTIPGLKTAPFGLRTKFQQSSLSSWIYRCGVKLLLVWKFPCWFLRLYGYLFTPSQLPKLVWLSMFIFTFHSNGANAKIYDAKCSGPTASAQIHGAKCSGPNSWSPRCARNLCLMVWKVDVAWKKIDLYQTVTFFWFDKKNIWYFLW